MPTPAWLTPLYRPESITLGSFQILTNVGAAYDTIANAKGLGMARVDFTNVTSLEFGVFVNKIGTGTQSWQLWNVTDGVQIAVIDDAAVAADNKLLTVTVNSGLPTGLKTVRVRAKSTVAADDPTYYGGYLLLS